MRRTGSIVQSERTTTPRDEFNVICRMLVDALAPPIVSTPEEIAKRRAERMRRLEQDAEEAA
jgi:hypothetical protein